MRVPEEAIRRACDVLSGGVSGAEEDQATRDLAERVLLAVIPSIRVAERQVIAGVVPPDELEELAHLVNLSPQTVRKLQLWARILRARPDEMIVA